MNKSTIQRYETGQIKSIKIPCLHAIAKALNVNPDYLALKTDELTPFEPHFEWYKKNNGNISVDELVNKGKKIPVLGSVPAGIPLEAVEDIIDWEEIPEDMARLGEYFALRIRGTSMEPRIREGDVVIVRQQERVENGEIAVVRINGNESTVKKFYDTGSGVMLVGLNPAFEPLTYTREQLKSTPVCVLGKVVELRAKF